MKELKFLSLDVTERGEVTANACLSGKLGTKSQQILMSSLISWTILLLLVVTPVHPDPGPIRQFEALALFGSGDSEFFTLTNAHPGPSTYQLFAFNGNKYGKPISYGQYTKGAFSLSGGVDLKLESDAGEITVAANILAGSFYMMYLYSNEGQTIPQLGVYQFTKDAFETAISAGLATIFFMNLVRLRDMQIFINGVLFVDLPAPEEGKDPIIPQPLTLGPSDFNSIMELYDTSNPGEKILVARGQLKIAAKRVYVCHVMGDPRDQESYPYTISMYKHSLSAAVRLTGPSVLMHLGLALLVALSIL